MGITMKIEINKITKSDLPNEYDIMVKENHKIYGFILYEYHNEYLEQNNWYLAYIGSYNKFDKDIPVVYYSGKRPGCEFEEETTYEDYKTTLKNMLEIVKMGECE